MALMLIKPIEPVIFQLRRVLSPGAHLAAVVGGPSIPDSIGAEIGLLIGRFLKEHFPNMAAPLPGAVAVDDYRIVIQGGMDAVWDFHKDMYLVGMLPDELKPLLREQMAAVLEPHCGAQGRVAFEYPLRKFEVVAS